MGTLLHSESRRLYSWWWDSHISPKNSKWLQDNLTDMDGKVKAMIKLIEEDADSFARRAEMYYKKRPELMKLVEEFYRAYRALAERYDHATGELRQAHRTMVQAFPDFVLGDETASNSEPNTPETPHSIRASFDPDQFQGLSPSSLQGLKRTGTSVEESGKGISRKGLKQFSDIFRSVEGVPQKLSFTDGKAKAAFNERKLREGNSGDLADFSKQNQKCKGQIHSVSDRAGETETELQTLKEALAKQEVERDAILVLYRCTLDKLCTLEENLNHAEQHYGAMNGQACKAKAEIQALKEAHKKSEGKRDAIHLQYQQSLEKLAAAEDLVSKAEEDAKRLSKEAMEAENDCKNLSQELNRLKVEKEAAELLYKQNVDEIVAAEKRLALAEENLKLINDIFEKARSELKILKEENRKLNEDKEALAHQYEMCLQALTELQRKLDEALADNERLNSEILLTSTKLKGAEDQCVLLSKMNESLQNEAQHLSQKIAAADEELSRKQSEWEKLLVSLKDEQSRFLQAEATLHTLQNLHSQSQEEQNALTLELRHGLQLLKDLEICKQDLKSEIQQLKDENQTLNDLKLSSNSSQNHLEDEMMNLKEIKEKLEAEVRNQAGQSDGLQLQAQKLHREIEGLYNSYQALMQQVKSVGLDPESFSSTVKGLQDENERLKETSMKDKADREALLTRLQEMEELLERNAILENSLLEVHAELQRSKEKTDALQVSCRDLNEDKSTLVIERAAFLSQLQIITETMQNLLEKNASLQTSLCGASVELEGVREKSNGLEELCQLLSSERSNLLAERSSLVSRLKIVEQKLENLELRFTNLEDKYAGLETEKHSTLSQVDKLRISLDVEKQNHNSLVLTSEARLSGLESHIQDLREENKYRTKEIEEQLEKAVNAQVEIFILQNFIQDMEDKNFSLLVECQRQVEASEYSGKLITELESENLIQQLEAEILLDKIEILKGGINQVLKALEIKQESGTEIDNSFLPSILSNIRSIKSSLFDCKEENQQLQIEKLILSTVLEQLYLDYAETSSKKATVEQKSLLLAEQLVMLEHERQNLLERSRQLNLKFDEKEEREAALKAEVKSLLHKQDQLQGSYLILEEENLKTSEQNSFLREELCQIKEENHYFGEENSRILVDTLFLSIHSVILNSYGVEKASELGLMSEDLHSLGKAYRNLVNEAKQLEKKLQMKDMENLALESSMEKLREKQLELCAANDKLRQQVSHGSALLSQKKKQLSELEQKIKAEQDIKAELYSTTHCLESEHAELEVKSVVLEKQMVELSDYSKCQEEKIRLLQEANGSLDSELGKLQEELEEHKIIEVILASELHERSSEFELWEAEATAFYFDLQICSVREALFENKVHELGSFCEVLEDISNQRRLEIEKMKLRVSSLESDADALKSEATGISELMEESSSPPDVILELQKLQARIMEIENRMNRGKATDTTENHASTRIRLTEAVKEIEDLKTRINPYSPEEYQQSSWECQSSASETKIGAEMKDIPLDLASGQSFCAISRRSSGPSEEQMLELWEAAEHDYNHDRLIGGMQEPGIDTIENEIAYDRSGAVNQNRLDPSPESHFEKELGVDTLRLSRNGTHSNKNKNVLEKLSSDAQKLSSLLISAHDLKRKIEPNKRRKKNEDADFETIRGQLEEMEYSLVQLMTVNTELIRTSEESSTAAGREMRESNVVDSIKQKRLPEEANKEGERIAKLGVEMQRIQYAFLRMIDAKKSKVKDAISRRNAAVLLREFFYSRGRKSKKPKKSRFCGCLRPTAAKT